MSKLHRCGKAPCGSCPYRTDVPAGIWDASEYEKLPAYDGAIFDQLASGATALFFCHQQDGKLCAGWVASHNKTANLAMRLNSRSLDDSVWDYDSPVPVFASGAEAAEHGLSGVEDPDNRARVAIAKLTRKIGGVK